MEIDFITSSRQMLSLRNTHAGKLEKYLWAPKYVVIIRIRITFRLLNILSTSMQIRFLVGRFKEILQNSMHSIILQQLTAQD